MVIQRVTRARVTVEAETVGEIGPGLLLLVGIAGGDRMETAGQVAQKCAELRLFAGAEGRFDRSLFESGGEALVVSQFTLLADVRKGRRPSFTAAARPEQAERLVHAFAEMLRERGVRVATGRFGASMHVELVNDGPVTIVLDSADLGRS